MSKPAGGSALPLVIVHVFSMFTFFFFFFVFSVSIRVRCSSAWRGFLVNNNSYTADNWMRRTCRLGNPMTEIARNRVRARRAHRQRRRCPYVVLPDGWHDRRDDQNREYYNKRGACRADVTATAVPCRLPCIRSVVAPCLRNVPDGSCKRSGQSKLRRRHHCRSCVDVQQQ